MRVCGVARRAIALALLLAVAACGDDAYTDRVDEVPATPATAVAPPPSARRCRPDELHLATEPRGVALGHWAFDFVFTNTGTSTCALTGYPELMGRTDEGRWQPVAADRTTAGYIVAPGAVGPLAPGERAVVRLQGASVFASAKGDCAGDDEAPPSYEGWRITVPESSMPLEVDGPRVERYCDLALSPFGAPG